MGTWAPFVWMWTMFLKVFTEFVTILLLFLCFGFWQYVGSYLPEQG